MPSEASFPVTLTGMFPGTTGLSQEDLWDRSGLKPGSAFGFSYQSRAFGFRGRRKGRKGPDESQEHAAAVSGLPVLSLEKLGARVPRSNFLSVQAIPQRPQPLLQKPKVVANIISKGSFL